MPKEQLHPLSEDQRARAKRLHISEGEYAVAMKAAELASERALQKMEHVARLIAQEVRRRDPNSQLKAVLWDFSGHRFEFVTRLNGLGECIHWIPTEVVDDVLSEKEGAEQRLRQAVSSQLSDLNS